MVGMTADSVGHGVIRKLAVGTVGVLMAMASLIAVIGPSTASAAINGCPNGGTGNPQTSNRVGASAASIGNTVTYTFISFVTEGSGGVPGLIEFCVYSATRPNTITVDPSAKGADLSAWTDPAAFDSFSFQRPDGNPSNIPYDGSSHTLGTATWSSGPPTGFDKILLHINDAAECDTLYGGNPGTCFVLPGGGGGGGPMTPTVTTEIHNDSGDAVVSGPVDLGTSVHDKASVGGTTNGTPTGTVTFTFYQGGDCVTGTAVALVPADTVALVSGVAHPSPTRGPIPAGSYAFRAHFNTGDTANWTDADSNCEPLTVSKGDLALSTEIHLGAGSGESSSATVVSAAIPLGSTVHDKATVGGLVAAFPPSLSVNFSFYTGNCTSSTSSSAGSPAIASGAAHPSNDEGPLGAGSYAFQASYGSTDPNYNSTTSPCEPLTVNKGDLALSTDIHNAAEAIVTDASFGPTVPDKATAAGSGAA